MIEISEEKKILAGKVALALTAIGAIVAIIVVFSNMANKDDNEDAGKAVEKDAEQTAAQNDDATATETEATDAAQSVSATRLSKHSADNFFSSGMGYLKNKDSAAIEEEYRKFMITNSGSGVLRLNPNQISREIKRITDDRAAQFLEEVGDKKPATYDASLGKNGSMDERLTSQAITNERRSTQ